MKKILFVSSILFLTILGCKKEEENLPEVAPGITEFSPASGPSGTEVSITGLNFGTAAGENEISFTQDLASKAAVVKASTGTNIKVEVPADLAPGDYAIVVKTKGKSATSTKKFTVTPLLHSITSVSPTQVAKNSVVTITGSHFSSTLEKNLVSLIKSSDAPIDVALSEGSETSLKFEVPTAITPGEYVVRVTIDGHAEEASLPLVIQEDVPPAPVPTITSFSPEEGTAGSQVTITGTHFNSALALNEVSLIDESNNVVNATVNSANETTIQFTLPENIAPGAYTVRLSSDGQIVEAQSKFTVTVPAPVISSFSPESGYPGSQFTITGEHFGATAQENEVTLTMGSETPITVTIQEASATSLIVVLPGDISAGEYDIVVRVGNQTGGTVNKFTVLQPGPTPEIMDFRELEVTAGTSTLIYGRYFGSNISDNHILLVMGSSSVEAAVTSVRLDGDFGELEYTIPASTPAGNYKVRLTVNGRTSESDFELQVSEPHTITGFTPTTAEEGARITITGTNFSTVLSENIVKFYQDGFTVNVEVLEATSTTLLVQVPSPVFSGSHYIEVTINGVKVRSAERFTVGSYSTPSISSVSSTTINAGDAITITGTNFSYEPNVLYVVFILEGTTNRKYASISSSSPTEIVATTPGLSSGQYTLEVHKGDKVGTYASKITVN